jgi:hypothetical protein
MEKLLFGINMKMRIRAFSLIDLLTALFASGLLLAILTSNLPNYNSLLKKIQSRIGFEEQMVIFFLQLEEDFFSIVLSAESKKALADDFSFQRWQYNYNTSSFDEIKNSYQFQSKTQQIRRKINSGNYTSFLQAVSNFQYQVLELGNNFCLQISIQSIFDTKAKTQIFCRQN